MYLSAIFGLALMLSAPAIASVKPASTNQNEIASQLQVGDVVFIRIPSYLFTQVADTTLSWTNHVGVISGFENGEPVVAESRFPLSGQTTWSKFVARSEQGRVAVRRLGFPLSELQQVQLRVAIAKRSGVFYDTGFDLYSRRQFCSRFVREVLDEAVGVQLGDVENFTTLLTKNPNTNLTFWRTWYFGYIPWQRQTVSPASLYQDDGLQTVFDGSISRTK